jgi:competence protein ComEA
MKPMAASIVVLTTAVFTASAQQLPEGPGRAEMEKICKGCHEMSRSISPRLDREGWNEKMTKMAAFGMKATEQEYQAVLDYLVKNFPADEVPKINVNKATAIQLESALSLRRSQAAAVIAYRSKNGDFKSIDDLKKVPLIDAEKIDAKKDRIVF